MIKSDIRKQHADEITMAYLANAVMHDERCCEAGNHLEIGEIGIVSRICHLAPMVDLGYELWHAREPSEEHELNCVFAYEVVPEVAKLLMDFVRREGHFPNDQQIVHWTVNIIERVHDQNESSESQILEELQSYLARSHEPQT